MCTEAAPHQLAHALPRQQQAPASGPGPPPPASCSPAPCLSRPYRLSGARSFNSAHWILVPVPKLALEEQLSCGCAKPLGRPGVTADREAREGVQFLLSH